MLQSLTLALWASSGELRAHSECPEGSRNLRSSGPWMCDNGPYHTWFQWHPSHEAGSRSGPLCLVSASMHATTQRHTALVPVLAEISWTALKKTVHLPGGRSLMRLWNGASTWPADCAIHWLVFTSRVSSRGWMCTSHKSSRLSGCHRRLSSRSARSPSTSDMNGLDPWKHVIFSFLILSFFHFTQQFQCWSFFYFTKWFLRFSK